MADFSLAEIGQLRSAGVASLFHHVGVSPTILRLTGVCYQIAIFSPVLKSPTFVQVEALVRALPGNGAVKRERSVQV